MTIQTGQTKAYTLYESSMKNQEKETDENMSDIRQFTVHNETASAPRLKKQESERRSRAMRTSNAGISDQNNQRLIDEESKDQNPFD